MAKDDGWVYYYKNGKLLAYNPFKKKNNIRKLTKEERSEWRRETKRYDAFPTVYIEDKAEYGSLHNAIMHEINIFKTAEPVKLISNGAYKYTYVTYDNGDYRVIGRIPIDDEYYEDE